MEQCERSGQPLAEARLLELMITLCRGLHAMHISSIAHRDVKVGAVFTTPPRQSPLQPANLLLTDGQDELVLMDLGSAARASVTISSRSVTHQYCVQWGGCVKIMLFVLLTEFGYAKSIKSYRKATEFTSEP